MRVDQVTGARALDRQEAGVTDSCSIEGERAAVRRHPKAQSDLKTRMEMFRSQSKIKVHMLGVNAHEMRLNFTLLKVTKRNWKFQRNIIRNPYLIFS